MHTNLDTISKAIRDNSCLLNLLLPAAGWQRAFVITLQRRCVVDHPLAICGKVKLLLLPGTNRE
jgi:hypothetical protein